jgi:hypothetical protein
MEENINNKINNKNLNGGGLKVTIRSPKPHKIKTSKNVKRIIKRTTDTDIDRYKDESNVETNFSYTKDELKFINREFAELCYPYTYTPAILPARSHIVVLGDIHGDLALAVDMLTKSKVANYDNYTGKITWIGGDTCIVQVGDQIDRCRPIPGMPCNHPKTTYNDEPNDIKIMEMFNDLDLQARKQGGLVISLLGNHEIRIVSRHQTV